MTGHHYNVHRPRMLDSEERLKELRPHELLADVAGLGKGMTGVDLGSGTGTFAFPMLQCVGDKGTVYAVDDNPEMLDRIRAKNPPANLVLAQRDVSQTGLDSQIADLCLLAFILHEVNDPNAVIVEAFRLLKPGGRAVVVEWRAELESPGPPRNIRFTRERLESLLSGAGFADFKYLEWSNNHYVATGTRRITR